MPDPPSTAFVFAFGTILVVAGLWLIGRHRRTQDAREADPALSEGDRRFYRGQHRRRTTTSILLVLLGILVPFGDLLFERGQRPDPLPLTIYWLGVLSMVLFMLIMAVVDLFLTSIHTRDALTRVRTEQAALERDLQEFRRSLDRDGR